MTTIDSNTREAVTSRHPRDVIPTFPPVRLTRAVSAHSPGFEPSIVEEGVTHLDLYFGAHTRGSGLTLSQVFGSPGMGWAAQDPEEESITRAAAMGMEFPGARCWNLPNRVTTQFAPLVITKEVAPGLFTGTAGFGGTDSFHEDFEGAVILPSARTEADERTLAIVFGDTIHRAWEVGSWEVENYNLHPGLLGLRGWWVNASLLEQVQAMVTPNLEAWAPPAPTVPTGPRVLTPPPSRAVADVTLTERLAKVSPLMDLPAHQRRVRVTSTEPAFMSVGRLPDDLADQVLYLRRVDRYDPRMTFSIATDPDDLSGSYIGWAYDVEVVDPVDTPTTSTATATDDIPATESEAAGLREEVARLQSLLNSAREEQEEFKREVSRTAMRYAKEHGWCGVVREALDDIGVAAVVPRTRFEVVIRVPVSGIASQTDPSASWVQSSLSTDWSEPLEGEDAITLDSDWDEVEVDTRGISYSVENVTTTDE